MSTSRKTTEVFCCYAPEDVKWFKQLKKQLRLFEREERISLWHEQAITAGTNQQQIIKKYLEKASIILLLISANFIDCDDCYSVLKQALERNETGEAQVIPILVDFCLWQKSPIESLLILPRNEEPISAWRPVDKGWAHVVKELWKLIENPSHTSHATPSHSKTIPHGRNPTFTGREEKLIALATALKSSEANSIQAISGLGGVGKTQIAIEYVYRYEQDYDDILWVNANTIEALIEGYMGIARQLDLPEKNMQDQNLIVNAVKTWLEKKNSQQWLLILDNAKAKVWKTIDKFIPHRFYGHILLTTQARTLGDRHVQFKHKVEGMSLDDGALLLLRCAEKIPPKAPLEDASRLDIDRAKDLCRDLGGLPLALDQAGAYITETECGLLEYQDLYRQQRIKIQLLDRRGDSENYHSDSVVATFNLSFDNVTDENPHAADLLHLCAFLAHDFIPEDIITKGAPHLGRLASIDTNPLLFNNTIKTLRGYSLIRRDEVDSSLWVHSLVQVVLKEQTDDLSKKEWAERAVRAVSAALPSVEPVKPEDRPRWERIVPHAQVCAQYIEDHKMQFKEATDLLSNTGLYLTERAQYEDAEKLLRQSRDIFERFAQDEKDDPYPFARASVLRSLANVYSEVGKYKEAEEQYKSSLHIFEREKNHREIARLLNNLAIIFKVQYKFKAAEDLYKRSLDIWWKYRDTDLLKFAQSLNNLAVLYAEQISNAEPGRNYTMAIRYLILSLKIQMRHPGDNFDVIARTLNNLANLFTQQADNRVIPPPLLTLIQEIRAWQQEKDPDAKAYLLNNSASFFSEPGRTYIFPYQAHLSTGAEELYQANLGILEELYQVSVRILEENNGPEHPDVAYPLNGLATLYYKQGKYAEAKKLYYRSLSIWQQRLSDTHPQVAYSFNNLAVLYYEQGEYGEAEPFCKKALETFEKSLGIGHSHIRICAANLTKIRKLKQLKQQDAST